MTQEFLQGLRGACMVVDLEALGAALAVGPRRGAVVSVFQAVTQIQEMTLTFMPKVIVAAIVLMMMGPWMLSSCSRSRSRSGPTSPT